jgi:hypothetical protein
VLDGAADLHLYGGLAAQRVFFVFLGDYTKAFEIEKRYIFAGCLAYDELERALGGLKLEALVFQVLSAFNIRAGRVTPSFRSIPSYWP